MLRNDIWVSFGCLDLLVSADVSHHLVQEVEDVPHRDSVLRSILPCRQHDVVDGAGTFFGAFLYLPADY